MKALLVAITAGALGVISAGQNAGPANAAGQDASVLSGTDLVGELNKSIDSKKVKPGDTVKGTVTQDVLAHGKIIIPRGSKLLGHVTEVKTRSKDDQESRLGMIFDKAVEKDGREITFSAAVRALAPGARLRTVNTPDEMTPTIVSPMVTASGPQRVLSGSTTPARTTSRSGSNTGTRSSQYTLSKATTALTSDYGLMSGGSRGVFGLPGLKLNREQGAQSVVTSTTRNVKLDSGTQIVIQIINSEQ